MSTVSLKNESKKTASTFIAPYVLNTILNTITKSTTAFALSEIKFQSPTKIEFTFVVEDIDASTYACTNAENPHRELLERAIESYHASIRSNANLSATYPTLPPEIGVAFPDVTSMDELHGIAIAKCNKKNDLLVTLVNFKNISAIPATTVAQNVTVVASPVDVAAAPVTEIKTKTEPQQKQPNIHKTQCKILTSHVMDIMFSTKQSYDFLAIAKVHKLQQQLTVLDQQLSYLTKNKDKVAVHTQIDALKAQITPEEQEQYDTFQHSLNAKLYPDVVNITNQGYSKGLTSVFQHPAQNQ